MSKSAESPLILRAVGQATYVNVGGGNITSVGASMGWGGATGTRITFVGEGYVFLEGAEPANIVERLRSSGGFGQ